ncbi:dihydroxyacetone kinase subunit L [Vibrio aestuarianus]|uniref:dihydroxyacetone kinase subunit DhaL n=1 Tax=Vibrio aestuarianus TaxID=28171 RepID=UPI001559E62D|nr:dihydroxyacetone kinase subunit DhaL [Vibrio aestuarianus]NGZ14732.1 dihydroxyacetone kinase subunit L [Vibrio aestuarianus]NKZ50880.1 dihydroxyacetone kinase subunit L [Vibrio aestuarianus]
MQIEKQHIIHWIELCAQTYQENKVYLDELDSDLGDGDHGFNMSRGFSSAANHSAQLQKQSISTILKNTGLTLRVYAGGASGIFYSTFFFCASNAVGSRTHLTLSQLLDALRQGCEGVISRGRALRGDKTMCDVWLPTLETGKTHLESGLADNEVLEMMQKIAEESVVSTVDMQAKKGRARQLGKESIGYQDPGATSSLLMLKALVNTLKTDLD